MHNGRQRYECRLCRTKFQDERRVGRLRKVLWDDYLYGKQTLRQLSVTHGRSVRSVQSHLNQYQPPPDKLTPQPIVVIADGFFFGRGVGTMLFRAANLHRNVHWFPIGYETISDYAKGIDHLERDGWTIQAVVCDGRPGVKKALEASYPVQMCHFHQVQIVTRYLTRNPVLPAAIQLKAIVATLARTTETALTAALDRWHGQWGQFLKQRTVNPDTKRWFYTHRRVRAAYRSLRTNLPYLFTYQRYPELHIPNTTNSLDGSISHLRDKLRAHRGLKLHRRRKLTEELLKGISP